MRKLDIVNYTLAALLLLATVPMYRYLIERSREGDTRPAVSPRPVVVVRASRAAPALPQNDSRSIPLQPGSEGGVKCWNGLLMHQTGHTWVAVSTPDGRGLALCQIQVEPARPQNSEASEQTP